MPAGGAVWRSPSTRWALILVIASSSRLERGGREIRREPRRGGAPDSSTYPPLIGVGTPSSRILTRMQSCVRSAGPGSPSGTWSVRVKRVRCEADRLGSARGQDVERVVGLRRSPTRLRRARAGPTRPNKLCSNKVLYVERGKAVGNLLRRLALVADELEHSTIGIFHAPTVLLVAGVCRRDPRGARCATPISAGGQRRPGRCPSPRGHERIDRHAFHGRNETRSVVCCSSVRCRRDSRAARRPRRRVVAPAAFRSALLGRR